MNTFGLSIEDYSSLLQASARTKYKPSEEKIELAMVKHAINREDATTLLKLLNSPARNTFTRLDIAGYFERNSRKK